MVFIWQLSMIRSPEKTLFSGVLLKGKTPGSYASRSSFGNAWLIFKSYFFQPCAFQELRIESGDKSVAALTDSNGGFFAETEEYFGDDLSLSTGSAKKALPVPDPIKNIHNLQDGGLSVISDIDDTILVSHTGKKLLSIYNTLFRPYHKRRAVRFTRKLFESLQTENPDHFYVSRSEYNLYPMIWSFIEHKSLPKGPIALTPFRRYKELLRSQKDPEFKYKTIEYIIRSLPRKEFILVGDDSQSDIDIYTKIGAQFKDRIRAVYIRQTDEHIKTDKSYRWENLKEKVPNAFYFGKNDEYIQQQAN